MSLLLWITIEMEYKIKCLNFFVLTNCRQKLEINSTVKGLNIPSEAGRISHLSLRHRLTFDDPR